MQVRKCTNNTLQAGEPACKSQEEIDDFVKDVSVKTWAVQSKIDFSKYNPEKPI